MNTVLKTSLNTVLITVLKSGVMMNSVINTVLNNVLKTSVYCTHINILYQAVAIILYLERTGNSPE